MSTDASSGSSSNDKSFDRDLFDNVELVYQRLTKGRHDLKRLKSYFEARAEITRAWIKTMKKATEQPDLEDSSNISNVWKEIRDTGISQMRQQEQFANGCIEISQVLESQIVEIKKTKTTLHSTWTKMLADVKKKQQAHDKAKDSYYESVKQAETSLINRDAAHEQRLPDKQVQKAETRAKQCLKEVETLHAAYQKAVNTLQDAQDQHDSTVVDLLQQFEKLERSRMKIFLEQLDKFAGQHDLLKANLDAVTASLHASVTAVNIATDVQQFILANATGKPALPHVEYIPCISKIIDNANGGSSSAMAAAAAATSSPRTNSTTIQPAGMSQFTTPSGPSSSSPFMSTAKAGTPVAAGGATNGSAAVVPAGDYAVALYDFEQNEPDDLPFKAGETIKLLSSPEGEDWWQGEKNGKIGIFPKAYVAKAAGGPSTSTEPAKVVSPPPPAATAVVQPPPQAASPVAAAHVSPPPLHVVSPPPQPAVVHAVPPPQPAAAVHAVPPPQPAPAAAAAASSNPFGDEGETFTNEPAAAAAPAEGGAEVPKVMDAHCAALFDFDGQDEDELSFKVGQILVITGELNGWYLGKVDGTEKIGIFPSNYVNITASS